jgi:hypothetical protein
MARDGEHFFMWFLALMMVLAENQSLRIFDVLQYLKKGEKEGGGGEGNAG